VSSSSLHAISGEESHNPEEASGKHSCVEEGYEGHEEESGMSFGVEEG
jgi:hypothetical protein